MENGKLGNEFAKKLAEDLDGMGFEEGVWKIREAFEGYGASCDASDLCSAYGYKYRNECEVMVDGYEEKGINTIYFKLNINPTHEEMICLLEEYGEYDEDEEYDENEIYGAFAELVDNECFNLNYDELVNRFDDVQTYWDVMIDGDGHYYRGSDGVLYEYTFWALANEE